MKKIGVRKVLGTKVKDIVRLLGWQFLKPVLIATIIAWLTVAGNTTRVAKSKLIKSLKGSSVDDHPPLPRPWRTGGLGFKGPRVRVKDINKRIIILNVLGLILSAIHFLL